MAFLSGQVRAIFDLVNKNLRKLDNGGYRVKLKGKIQRFENSDVKIKNTYVDRTDGNKTKNFDSHDMFSHIFTFQEAVERMPGRSEHYLRVILVILGMMSTSECWPYLAAYYKRSWGCCRGFSYFAFLSFLSV